MSDIVVRPDWKNPVKTTSLPPVLVARDVIAKAVAEQDAAALRELRSRASAYELYNRRAGAMDVANDAGEIKVRAERALGQVDAEVAPHGVKEEFRGHETLAPLADVAAPTRAAWRKLGRLEEAEFEKRIADAREDESSGISTARLLIAGGAHVGNNSGDNEWYTPRPYIEAAVHVMGAIDLDPASTAEANEIVGAAKFYTEQMDGLRQVWAGRVWMNPPYARPLIDDFCAKLADSYANGDVSEACVLVNNATETGWFHALAEVAGALCFPRHRVKFWHPRKESVPLQGQAVIYFGTKIESFRSEFVQFGFTGTL